MKEFCLKGVNAALLVLISLSTLFSCTLDANAVKNAGESEMTGRVARMIDEQLTYLMSEDVAHLLSDEELALLMTEPDGRSIVSRALEEEGGEKYIEYSYTAVTSDNADEILRSARELIPEDEYEKLEAQVDEVHSRSRAFFLENSRAMNNEQRKKFYNELQSLVVKAVVLLTAAVVYACIPTVVVWGKVSAACVAAVAAGILASGIMTVVGYRSIDSDSYDFPSWLTSVYEDSFAQWAIASSVITASAAAGRSPVITALILVAFTVYDVFDEARAMFNIVNK